MLDIIMVMKILFFSYSFPFPLSLQKKKNPTIPGIKKLSVKYSSRWIKFILCELNIIKSFSKFCLSFSNVKINVNQRLKLKMIVPVHKAHYDEGYSNTAV